MLSKQILSFEQEIIDGWGKLRAQARNVERAIFSEIISWNLF